MSFIAFIDSHFSSNVGSHGLILNLIFILMIACSVISWAIVIAKFVELTNIDSSYDLSINTFINDSKNAILQQSGTNGVELKINAFLSNIQQKMEKHLSILATFSSLVPFVGLLGTVIGIANALKAISLMGSANIAVIASPIGEALFSTAFGLFVAIPAGFFYNLFSTKIDNIITAKHNFIINKILS